MEPCDYKGHTHSDIGFELTQFPGQMAIGPKGGRVGAIVLFNKGLCTSATHENSGVERQRGCTSAVENGLWGVA